MIKQALLWCGIIGVSVLSVGFVQAQGLPTNGLYQIISGSYLESGGFAGTLAYPLPNTLQAFVQLSIDQQKNLAEMKILGPDKQTVFSIGAVGPNGVFTFSFSNGMVFPDHIQFGSLIPQPLPQTPSFGFIVSNSADGLQFNGTVFVPCNGCVDIPGEFEHANVVA